MTHKICSECKTEKPYSEFYPYSGPKNLKGGVMTRCKLCDNKRSAEWSRKNSEKVKARSRETYLKRSYNITKDEFSLMESSRDYKCDICKTKSKSLHIDHDHATGKVRGLLCLLCNTGLGKFKDNRELLLEAVRYLDERS